MCGIAGIFTKADPRPVRRERLAAMVRSIAHRGPDGSDFHIEPHVALGFCRLAIIDVAGGMQPISNEDDSKWLVFNGEIYNYKGLHDDLVRRGHTFRTKSDTETIIHAYEEWGADCVTKLRGIFAFAIWDRAKQQLFLARDHSGIKPLYVRDTADSLLFASEAKAILVDQPDARRLDLRGFGFSDDPDDLFERSCFEGVQALAPGCTATIDATGVSARRYWQYLPTDALDGERPAAYWVDAFAALFERSVREQVMSEVPIGAYLSGGVDSAAVVAHMAKLPLDKYETFTTVNRGVGDDEQFARVCVEALKVEHARFFDYDGRSDGIRHLPLLTWMSEGFTDIGYLARYQLARFAANQGVKVVLTGQGIDEILTGYFPSFSAFLATQAQVELNKLGPSGYRGPPPLRPEMWSLVAGDERTAARNGAAGLRSYHASLSRGLLRFEDTMGMAASVEVRVPLLDHELLELVAAIPHRQRFELLSSKAVLRRAVAPLLPREVVERPKFAFNATLLPMSRLAEAAGPPGEAVRDMMSDRALHDAGYFDPATVHALRASGQYASLDQVLNVQMLHDVFVKHFDPERFATPPKLNEVLPKDRRTGHRGPHAPKAGDVPRFKHSLAGLSVYNHHDVATGALVPGKLSAMFLERSREPLVLSEDAWVVLELVDGKRTYQEIATELGEESVSVAALLQFAQTLINEGVLRT